MVRRIYLDHAATTPVLPDVVAAMAPWLSEVGNPSSLHAEGRRAKAAIDQAREIVSAALGCLFAEVIFTSGGTEAANLAIVGAALANQDSRRRRILFGAAEHHCVLYTEPVLRRLGYDVELIPVDRIGRVRVDVFESIVGEDVLLVSAMHANNELGTLQPVREIGEIAHRAGALFHTDAVQTFLSLDWGVDDLGADLVSVSAHKVNGPKGVGALYVRAGTKLQPPVAGGGQEREMRGGTENVAGIVGFGEAVRVVPRIEDRRGEASSAFLRSLDMDDALLTVPEAADRLPGHVHLRIPGVQAETMLILLDRMGVGASSGAACSSGSIEPSHVLLACGYSSEEAKEGLRFTFGQETSAEEAREAACRVNEARGRLTK